MITVAAALVGVGTVLGVRVGRSCATRRERDALADVMTALGALRADIAALRDHVAPCGPPAAPPWETRLAGPPREHPGMNDTVSPGMLS